MALVAALKVAFAWVIVGTLTILFNVGHHSVNDATKAGAGVVVRSNITPRRNRKIDGYHFLLAVEFRQRAR